MVVENAYLQIVNGSEAEFERAFEEARPILLSAQGCTSAELLRDAEQPSAYLLRVRWERLADHLDEFPRSAVGQRFASQVAEFFAKDPEVRHFIDRLPLFVKDEHGMAGHDLPDPSAEIGVSREFRRLPRDRHIGPPR